MRKILVKLSERSYPIFIGVKLEDLGKYLKTFKFSGNTLIVTNPKVKGLYFHKLSGGLKRAGFRVNVVTIPDGEQYKRLEAVANIYKAATMAGLDRRSPVIALGGGVVGDVAGFAAATYMRGLPLIQAPTTLLAMVDSSVGGKTGVDLKEGKNLVGAFYQPKAVWIDISTLKTLPREHIENGMAEVIKYAVIKDAKLFQYLENLFSLENEIRDTPLHDFSLKEKNHNSWAPLERYEILVARCCAIKAEVVSSDEREEKGLREVLNFGHTFGHALETLNGYKGILHGQAVAIGMNFAASLAVKLNMLKKSDKARLKNLILQSGLGACALKRFSAARIISVMKRDKKTRDGKLRFVLPVRIGKVVVKPDISVEKIKEILS